MISFALSLALCLFAIQNIWMQWQERPVIVSFNDKITPVESIPFPAVTICSSQKFSNLSEPSKEKANHLRRLNDILTDIMNNKSMDLAPEE